MLAGVYAVLVVLPHLLSFSQKEVAVFLVINVLVVVSYRLLTLTGEWSLAHVVIMGVGAYASTLFAKRLGIPVPPAMLLGAGVAALTAYVLSFPLLRMKAFYFLIGSFAAGEVIRLCWKRFREPFGGPKGIKLIPSVPDIEIGGLQVMFFDPVNYYYLCLIVVSISLSSSTAWRSRESGSPSTPSTGRTGWPRRWGSTPAGTGRSPSSSPRSSGGSPARCSRTTSAP